MILLNVIKDTFVQLYEYLFRIVFLSLIMFILIIPLLLSYPVSWITLAAIPYILIISGPVLLSAIKMIWGLQNRESFSFKKFFRGIKRYFKRGVLAFLFTTVIYVVLVFDLWYFFSKSGGNIIFLIIALLMFYVFVFFSLMQLYFWPLLVMQEEESLRTIIKRSFLLTFDNIIFAIGLGIFFILYTVLATILVLPIPALYFGSIVLLVLNGTSYTLKKYEMEQEED
ncbi:MAG: DUF624 domain-containing protein [Halothermotrichaceae bacterium]